jgi:hypothetical protein
MAWTGVSGRHRATRPLEAAGDPLDDETAVLVGRLLPGEVASIQSVGLNVGKQVSEVLVVGPRYKVILAAGRGLPEPTPPLGLTRVAA